MTSFRFSEKWNDPRNDLIAVYSTLSRTPFRLLIKVERYVERSNCCIQYT